MNKRYIAEGSTEILFPNANNAAIYLREHNGKFLAMGYQGKRGKPDFHYNFKNVEQRQKYINEWIAKLEEIQVYKESRKVKRATFQHTLKVGDILYSSWGYEQTNIDFYQVVEVISQKTVRIQEIEGQGVGSEHGHDYGKITACKNEFKGEPMLKRVNLGNSITLTTYSNATPWDGNPMYYSLGY